MAVRMEHDEGQSRFLIHVDGREAGYTQYERHGDTWTFTHTVVESEFEGRGLAGQLVGHALDRVVADGGTIVPVCSYVAAYVQKNDHYLEHVRAPRD